MALKFMPFGGLYVQHLFSQLVPFRAQLKLTEVTGGVSAKTRRELKLSYRCVKGNGAENMDTVLLWSLGMEKRREATSPYS